VDLCVDASQQLLLDRLVSCERFCERAEVARGVHPIVRAQLHVDFFEPRPEAVVRHDEAVEDAAMGGAQRAQRWIVEPVLLVDVGFDGLAEPREGGANGFGRVVLAQCHEGFLEHRIEMAVLLGDGVLDGAIVPSHRIPFGSSRCCASHASVMIRIITGSARFADPEVTRRREVHRRQKTPAAERSIQLDDLPAIAIEQAEFFRALAPEQLARVRPQLRERRVERQRALFFEGEAAESLWVLGRGQVRLYKASASGRVTTLETLGPGRIFGAISALEQEIYPASAEGVTVGVAWCLPRSVLLKLLAEDPRVGVEVLRIVSRHLHEAHERLRSFAHDAAPARLARALLDASSDGEAHVTRRALAEAAGTTVETAIRVLRRFEREGVLHGEAGLLRVLDTAALRRIAGV